MSRFNSILILASVVVMICGFFIIPGIFFFQTFENLKSNIEKSPRNIYVEKDSLIYYNKNDEKNILKLKKDSCVKLYFWATWCKPCIAKFDSLDSIKGYNNEYLFITFEKEEKLKRLYKRKEYKFPLYRADSSEFIFKSELIPFYPSFYEIKNDTATRKSL